MLFCCSRELKPLNVFYAACENCIYKKIEYRICPHCKTPIYKETIKRFNNTETTPKTLKGEKAVKAFKRALLNRLTFFEKLKQGSRQNQNWYYGDFKRTNKKDKNGNFVELQIKKNFNNETVAILGEAIINYG